MVRIKHNLEDKREVELSTGETVRHNAYYLPGDKKRSNLYKGYNAHEGFGYGLADRMQMRKEQYQKKMQKNEDELTVEQNSNVKKRVLTR